MAVVWLCEKALQAADIAGQLGLLRRGSGFLETRGGVVTYASGHMFEQMDPEDYDPALASWRIDALPIVPEQWRLKKDRRRAGQLSIAIEHIKKADEVIIATDPDREGEAIAREILEYAKYRGPLRRFWTRGLDTVSLERAIQSLQPAQQTEPLYWASQARARADWLVGMNLTRCASLIMQRAGGTGVRTVGRVQTPTLALVVARDRAIEAFVAATYYEVEAHVAAGTQTLTLRHAPAEANRITDRQAAEALAQRTIGATGPLQVTTERKRQRPPALFSLPSLQMRCSARYGFAADKTLSVVQSLYEAKLVSYPRSDCKFLPAEQVGDVPAILAHLASLDTVGGVAERVAAAPVVRGDVFDTNKAKAHHAIIPTLLPAKLDALSPDDRKVYLMIAASYVAALSPDHEYDETRVQVDANGVALKATGRVTRVPGWTAVLSDEADDHGPKLVTLPPVANGDSATVQTARVDSKQTQPPKRYTEGTLLEDMGAIAKFCTDPAARARLKETSGIGTPATQGTIIRGLQNRGFLEARGKALVSTEAGRALIDFLPAELTDPIVTAMWEDQLADIADGKHPESARDRFVAGVATQVGRLVTALREAPAPSLSVAAAAAGRKGRGLAGRGSSGQSARPAPDRSREPSEKMLALATSIAKSRNLKAVPASVQHDFEACRSWIDEHGAAYAQQRDAGKPSDTQYRYAQNVAYRQGMVLPAECSTSKKACSEFLDAHKPNNGNGPR